MGLLIISIAAGVHAEGAAVPRPVAPEPPPESLPEPLPEELASLVLVSVDPAARRAVVKTNDDALRVVAVGDVLLEGRAQIEGVTGEKLVARYRMARYRLPATADGGHQRAGASDEWVRVWIHLRRSGESGSRVQVLRPRGPADHAILPVAQRGEPRIAADEEEGNGGLESPKSQR